MDYSKLRVNPDNPRSIGKKELQKLENSLLEFSKFLKERPILYDEDLIIWGGNQRHKALRNLINKGLLKEDPAYYKQLVDYTLEEKRTAAILDNSPKGLSGDWVYEILKEKWNDLPLEEWGITTGTETERLSELSFVDMYYTPEKIPNIKLKDCINTEKFDAKLKVIESADLPQEDKDVLKMFAYRFIKIDFENVANYYYFNANEEEKKVIERLRLVLCDGGVAGFIEDHLLKVYKTLEDWDKKDD